MTALAPVTDLDHIIAYLGHPEGRIELLERQEQMLERLDFAHSLMRNEFRTEKFTIDALQKKYSISRFTARCDIENAKQVYGTLTKSNKNYYRQVAINMALESYQIAKDAGDIKGMNDATAKYIDATGVKHEDPEMPNFTKLEQHNYIITPAIAADFGIRIPEDLQERVIKLREKKKVEVAVRDQVEVVGGDT